MTGSRILGGHRCLNMVRDVPHDDVDREGHFSDSSKKVVILVKMCFPALNLDRGPRDVCCLGLTEVSGGLGGRRTQIITHGSTAVFLRQAADCKATPAAACQRGSAAHPICCQARTAVLAQFACSVALPPLSALLCGSLDLCDSGNSAALSNS